MFGLGARAQRRQAALPTALALLLVSAGLTVASGPHERACGAAFGVLHRCAAAGGGRDGVRARCCGLLEAFQHNGCLWWVPAAGGGGQARTACLHFLGSPYKAALLPLGEDSTVPCENIALMHACSACPLAAPTARQARLPTQPLQGACCWLRSCHP